MIGQKTIEKAQMMVADLLITYQDKIREAYVKAEGGISISMTIKIEPNERKPECIDIEAGINFVESRVKESLLATISENQEPLFKK